MIVLSWVVTPGKAFGADSHGSGFRATTSADIRQSGALDGSEDHQEKIRIEDLT
jgi:hypothetical protein